MQLLILDFMGNVYIYVEQHGLFVLGKNCPNGKKVCPSGKSLLHEKKFTPWQEVLPHGIKFVP